MKLTSTKKLKVTNQNKAKFTCCDCKHRMSIQQDEICRIYCDIKNRDFTFSGENDEICEFFEED